MKWKYMSIFFIYFEKGEKTVWKFKITIKYKEKSTLSLT